MLLLSVGTERDAAETDMHGVFVKSPRVHEARGGRWVKFA